MTQKIVCCVCAEDAEQLLRVGRVMKPYCLKHWLDLKIKRKRKALARQERE